MLVFLFQSSPSPKAGSYEFDGALEARLNGFNPLPARRPGATVNYLHQFIFPKVSILSQPEGRELLLGTDLHRAGQEVSILSQPEGRELPLGRLALNFDIMFQSSPSPKAGSY